ncbi:MAG: polymerase, sigma-24 subunit, subfamily [Pedosphaera sp.]|nr:polymerase, sigma-24 subunit, subfamily [Pedosphaera sp.]
MTTDGELLRRYAETAAEEAFSELVHRHLDLVYSAALRQVNGDAHLAQDVAQCVFTDLARKAGSLSNRATLAGWLYTSTHFAAAKAVRTERRRQTHEQEAHAMQEILRDSEPNLDWETFRPVLDTAMQALSESDREVILLRYFENQPYAGIGEQIGLSENSARMRAERALEKLRTGLSRRGLTTAVALAAALSANAVTAAPAGMSAIISTTAALAGTTITTTTAIATVTKTITMTTIQKTLFAAVLVTALGAGTYEMLQASHLREQNQLLQQQKASLAGDMQELQRLRNDETIRLTALIEQNQQLKSAQNLEEVRKLRGQVGTLRQSLSSVTASNEPESGIASMMKDPAMKEYIHQAQLNMIRERYGALSKELKLTSEQSEGLTQLIGATWLKGSEMGFRATQGNGDKAEPPVDMDKEFADLDDQVKSLLGEAGYQRYKTFSQEIPARSAVKLLNGQLGESGLSEDQNARLIQIVAAEPYTSTHGISGELDKAFFGSQEEIDNHLQQVVESNQRILGQAASLLNAQQLDALANVLSNSVSAQKLQGAALTQKH